MKVINVRWQYNSVEVAVNRNITLYETGLSHSTSALQATQTTGPGAAAEYSRIGPSYETMRRQLRPVAGRNRISARLSERYEFQTHACRPWFQRVEEHKVKQLWIMKIHSNVKIVKITHTYNIEWTYTDFDLCVELNL